MMHSSVCTTKWHTWVLLLLLAATLIITADSQPTAINYFHRFLTSESFLLLLGCCVNAVLTRDWLAVLEMSCSNLVEKYEHAIICLPALLHWALPTSSMHRVSQQDDLVESAQASHSPWCWVSQHGSGFWLFPDDNWISRGVFAFIRWPSWYCRLLFIVNVSWSSNHPCYLSQRRLKTEQLCDTKPL